MRIPSQKRFVESFGAEVGTAAYRLAKGLDNVNHNPAVIAWCEQCYHNPSYGEKLMCALDHVLGGYGTEVIEGRYIDTYHQNLQAEYVNFGDTYATTVLLDHETDRLQITTWGDWVERHEKRRGIQ